jgi:hypothetical protein
MKTLDQYFPAMKEAPGRLFFVPRASINAGVAVALLAGVMAYAIHYPAMKENEAIQRLAHINDLIANSTAATQANISHLPALATGAPSYVQSVVKDAATRLQAQLAPIKPVTVNQIRDAMQHRRDEYAQAHALIAKSPFRGVPVNQVPATADGHAYLKALKVTAPPRLEYQQIELDALSRYRAALDVQDRAAKVEHQIDVQVNGDKAAPVKNVLVPMDLSQLATQEPLPSPSVSVIGRPEGAPQPVAQTSDGGSEVQGQAQIAAGQQQGIAAQQAAQQAEQQRVLAQQQAKERAARQRELAQEQARERAEQAAQQAALVKQRQAEQARQAAQQAEQQRVLAQQQAQEAAAEKARECTSSVFARLKCASQGYNPLTGQKRATDTQ